ncbi:gene transfer agent family protein [Stappia sp.]|uniref:gene transfer agent family protein n=1 Tax=Stappia sp. TaxID=1870903 RepID=UPI003A98E422
MVNRRRGEIEATIEGRRHVLVLTLGALAELEAAFRAENLVALAERFADGRLSAQDITRILGAGLRGGGWDIADGEVARLRFAGGAPETVRLVAALLRATFLCGSDEGNGEGGDPSDAGA